MRPIREALWSGGKRMITIGTNTRRPAFMVFSPVQFGRATLYDECIMAMVIPSGTWGSVHGKNKGFMN